MRVTTVDLKACQPQGQVACDARDSTLRLSALRSIPSKRFDLEHLRIRSCVLVPGAYRLPLRIDLTVKIDMPGLYVQLGDGHINFGTLCSDNRRLDDIVAPDRKPRMFDHRIPMDTWVELSLLYDLKEMQILVNGQERFYSNKERYMRSPRFASVNAANGEGFSLRLACDKPATLAVKAITVTEYEDGCGIVRSQTALPAPVDRNEAVPAGEKPTFDSCIGRLPQETRESLIALDGYLRSLRAFRFKRQLEKNGNKITYVASEHGFSYAVYLSNELFAHSLQWYLITSGPPETWHRKDDRMEAVLETIGKTDPARAQRLFDQLDDCVGCYPACLARTEYQLNGKRRQTCHGKLFFTMNRAGFDDVREVLDAILRLSTPEA